MNEKRKISGFLLKRECKIDELSCSLYEYEHERTGARAVYLDRDDDNKTFAIGFATPPEDSTGVFHIIEHSVLCGSERFPAKEPFVELLKSSLNTFLNAMTYPDKTVYPVASRCERDYLNLIEVYLDAVFFPLMKTDKRIFMQEGIHLEYDEGEDSLEFKGVVYNEMKGAYSAPEEAGFPELDAMLYEGTCYEHDSGGNPECIPSLTYEKFVEMHEKYYHPSNAVVAIDGRQDVEKTLSLVDAYFSRFERKNIEICKPKFTKSVKNTKEIYYDASEAEGEGSKARLLEGIVFDDTDDRLMRVAAGIIAGVLTDTNDSPLKHELLSLGLCEDVYASVSASAAGTMTLEYRGVSKDRLDEIRTATRRVCEQIVRDGIPRKKIESALNRLEFKSREADYGARPRGVVLVVSAITNVLRGALPETDMSSMPLYESARARIDEGYYEKLLEKIFLKADHKASVLVLPSDSFGREVAERERERLEKIRASFDSPALSEIVSAQNALLERQEGEDSPEALASIPRLALEDLPREVSFPACDRKTVLGVSVLAPRVETGGIVYTDILFDLSDLKPEELTLASALSAVYLSVPTEDYSLLELTDEIRSSLGFFSVGARKIQRTDGTGGALPVLSVSAAALGERYAEIPRLLQQVLLTSRLDDVERIKTVIKQMVMYTEEGMISGGETLAMESASARTNVAGAIEENLAGYTAFLRLKEYAARLEANPESFISELSALAERVIVKERLIISVTGMCAEKMALEIIDKMPSGVLGDAVEIPLFEKKEIGFAIPSRVSYAVSGAFSPSAREMLGALRVARHILSYEYLWNTIRVQGGAYGTGFVVRKSGEILYYSYRDPSPEKSLECYKSAPEALREVASSATDLSDFIIGAVGEYDILLSPRLKASVATEYMLFGWSEDDEKKLWGDMISTDRAALLRVADLLEELLDTSVKVVVGPEAKLSEIDGVKDAVTRI